MATPLKAHFPMRARVNPRLGTYFSIFVAAFIALATFLLILEQLGYPEHWVRLAMVIAPLAFASVIGIGAFSQSAEDYFAAGRRVPAFCNGIIIAVTALGGTGMLALTGLYYIVGVDALFLSLGLYAGLVLSAVTLVPFLRKFGAYTLPTYLAMRFESPALRMVSACVLILVAALILIAEMRVGAIFVKSVMRVDRSVLIWPVAVALILTVLPGGMRSLSWSNTAWGLIALIALLVPVGIVSVLVTNLPLPQITYGSALVEVTRLEALARLAYVPAEPLAFSLPGLGVRPMEKPFLQPFGSIGWVSFLIASLCVMLGTAALPSLLQRAGTATDAMSTRRAMGWAAFLLGLMLLTLPAIAVFTRHLVLTDVVGKPMDKIPHWFLALVQNGRTALETSGANVTLEAVRVRRDVALMVLPSSGFPTVVLGIATSGVIAAVCAAASANAATLATLISEDLALRPSPGSTPSATRLLAARVSLAAATLVAAWLSLRWTIDPLKPFLWGLSIAASAVFPVLVLSIWWKRITRAGALAGMTGGALIALLAILRDELFEGASWLGLDGTLSGAFGVPVALALTLAVSLVTPRPERQQIEMVRDMRVPGGESVHDRAVRLSRSQGYGRR